MLFDISDAIIEEVMADILDYVVNSIDVGIRYHRLGTI